MMAAVIGALVLIVAGSTILQDFLEPRQHTAGVHHFLGRLRVVDGARVAPGAL